MITTAEELIAATDHIPSQVFPTDQELWFRYIKDLPGNPVIVDFGTGHGRSAASLALSCPQGVVYTFDPGLPYLNDQCSPAQYEAETNKYILDSGAMNFVFSMESSLTKPWDIAIDVLNIDSDHTYETTKAEMLKWIPYVKTGGLVFLHDYEHPRCPGIKQAIDELIPSMFNMELLEIADSGQNNVKGVCFKKL